MAVKFQMGTPRNERERAHAHATQLVADQCQQLISGLITLTEFLDSVERIKAWLPELQIGDHDPVTGLRRR